MIFPLYAFDSFGRATSLVLGVLLGMAFGVVLERAGFGRASNLAAQFYGGDNRVLKVMFTGIATTTVLLGALSGFGFLDIDRVTVPETFLGPQIVGGLLLGVGFVIAGYCPGTGIVAAASGSIDGFVSYLGVMLGSLVFGLGWPWVADFYASGAMGSVRIDQILGVPFSAVAFVVFVIAVVAFFGAERMEGWFAGRRGGLAPDQEPVARNGSLGMVGVAAGVGAVLAVMPTASAEQAALTIAPVDAVTLATRIVDDPTTMWIVDLRAPAACAAARIPGAVCVEEDTFTTLPTSRTLVVYADAQLAGIPDALQGWKGRVEAVTGGYAAFKNDVLTAPVPPTEPTPASLDTWERRAALNGYFTGASAPRPAAPAVVRKASAGAPMKKGGGC